MNDDEKIPLTQAMADILRTTSNRRALALIEAADAIVDYMDYEKQDNCNCKLCNARRAYLKLRRKTDGSNG